MSAVRILGIGSPHGDDRVGWAVVEALAASGALARHAAEALCCDRPGLRLAALLAGAEHAILVDALRGGGPPGRVRWLAPGELAVQPDQLSAHGFGVAEGLALARALGTLPRRLSVIGIEIATTRPDAPLSAAARAGVAAAAAEIERELAGGRAAPPA